MDKSRMKSEIRDRLPDGLEEISSSAGNQVSLKAQNDVLEEPRQQKLLVGSAEIVTGQLVQALKVADRGIRMIDGLLCLLATVSTDALQSKKSSTRQYWGEQFNELLRQVHNAAKDSYYCGLNMLQGSIDLEVKVENAIPGEEASVIIKGCDIRGPADKNCAVTPEFLKIRGCKRSIAIYCHEPVSTQYSEYADIYLDWGNEEHYEGNIKEILLQIEESKTILKAHNKALAEGLNAIKKLDCEKK